MKCVKVSIARPQSARALANNLGWKFFDAGKWESEIEVPAGMFAIPKMEILKEFLAA